MAKLKSEFQRRGCKFIVCYADNNALHFFLKQGFRRFDAKTRLANGDCVDQSFFEANKFKPQELKERIEHYRRATLMLWAPDLTTSSPHSDSDWAKSESAAYSQKLSSFRNRKYESK